MGHNDTMGIRSSRGRRFPVGLVVYGSTQQGPCSKTGDDMRNEQSFDIQVMTVRELGDVAADRGVSAASLLERSGPQPAPSTP